jgi:hypothetical protein
MANKMEEQIVEIAKKYGFFVIGGAIGAVVHRLRAKMSWSRFACSVVISMFVALCVGIVARDYFNITESVVYAMCGMSGVFSEIILDEIQESLQLLPDWLRSKLRIKERIVVSPPGKDEVTEDTKTKNPTK